MRRRPPPARGDPLAPHGDLLDGADAVATGRGLGAAPRRDQLTLCLDPAAGAPALSLVDAAYLLRLVFIALRVPVHQIVRHRVTDTPLA